MPLTNNPNKTKTIEKRWRNEIRARFREFSQQYKQLPLLANAIVINVDEEEQQENDLFIAAFTALAISILLGGENQQGQWQNKYQSEAYKRSLLRSISELKAQLTQPDLIKSNFLLDPDTAINLPEHKNELNFLKGRADEKLIGWVQSLINDVKSIVHNNVGVDKEQLINLIQERVNVTESRARLIATTEITQASQRAVKIHAEQMALALNKEVGVRWITVGDSKVRHLHAAWHGMVFTPDQAQMNYNVSPWNCRCALKTVVKERDPARLRAKFKKERKFLMSKEAKS